MGGVKERLEAIEASKKRRKALPVWVEGLSKEQGEAFGEACQAFVDLRRGGSRLGIPALLDIIEEDCGKRWAAKTIGEYLDERYSNGWR